MEPLLLMYLCGVQGMIVIQQDMQMKLQSILMGNSSDTLQTALCMFQQWCDKAHLSVSENEMVIIPFAMKRDSFRYNS
jgi:hypothetical protein